MMKTTWKNKILQYILSVLVCVHQNKLSSEFLCPLHQIFSGISVLKSAYHIELSNNTFAFQIRE